jgi:hypothetical protein
MRFEFDAISCPLYNQYQYITIMKQSGLPCPRFGGVGAASAGRLRSTEYRGIADASLPLEAGLCLHSITER